MMGRTSKYDSDGRNTGSSTGLSMTSGAANTKGAYLEYFASTSYPAQGFIVFLGRASDTASDALIDVAIGAAGSEVVIINNLVGRSIGDSAITYYVPIGIAAGSRVAMRVQCVGATNIYRAGITLCAKHPDGISRSSVTTYGAATADSGGTSVDPGAVLNTKGAYSEITSSTTYDHDGFILALGEQNNFVRSSSSYLIDVAVGAAASEIIVVPDLIAFQAAAGDSFNPPVFFLDFAAPAGTRIAVRAQANITDATDRLFDATIYGIS